MADWGFFGWTYADSDAANVDTSAGHASAIALNTASALSFGSGSRSTFQQNISLNTWNTAMHFAKDTAEASTDYCDGAHLKAIYPIIADFTSRDTAAYVAGTYKDLANLEVHSSDGVGLRFRHGTAVKTNPVYLWGGSGGDAASDPQSCYIAMVDLTSSVPTWSTTKPGNKLQLKSHGTPAEEHWWSVGIALQPYVVGHNGENKMKVEATYF